MMHRAAAAPTGEQAALQTPKMDILVGYVLGVGVVASIVLILAGLVWHWVKTGDPHIEYSVRGMTLVQFILSDEQQWVDGLPQPRLLLNTGFTVLMLTPYVRVFVSMVYFGFWERNWKYTLFTALVFSVLTYSLFLH